MITAMGELSEGETEFFAYGTKDLMESMIIPKNFSDPLSGKTRFLGTSRAAFSALFSTGRLSSVI